MKVTSVIGREKKTNLMRECAATTEKKTNLMRECAATREKKKVTRVIGKTRTK